MSNVSGFIFVYLLLFCFFNLTKLYPAKKGDRNAS